VRYDNSSDFGSTLNPRVGLVWRAAPGLTAKFLYGKAFRAPSFQELYQQNNPVALGNSNLEPEHIQTWEAAIDYRPSNNRWNIGANIFTYRLTNKILFIRNSDIANYLAQNAGSQKGKGVVLEAGWMLSKNFKLSGNYAYQLAEDQEKHDIANVPIHDVYLQADWQMTPSWHFNLQGNGIFERRRAANDPREPVKDYFSLDLAVHYARPKSPWQLTFGARNLFDANIREPTPGPDENGMIKIPYDLPMAGVNYFFEFDYRF
jgi:iron complex outermembrane receptor protein